MIQQLPQGDLRGVGECGHVLAQRVVEGDRAAQSQPPGQRRNEGLADAGDREERFGGNRLLGRDDGHARLPGPHRPVREDDGGGDARVLERGLPRGEGRLQGRCLRRVEMDRRSGRSRQLRGGHGHDARQGRRRVHRGRGLRCDHRGGRHGRRRGRRCGRGRGRGRAAGSHDGDQDRGRGGGYGRASGPAGRVASGDHANVDRRRRAAA